MANGRYDGMRLLNALTNSGEWHMFTSPQLSSVKHSPPLQVKNHLQK